MMGVAQVLLFVVALIIRIVSPGEPPPASKAA
jgi:hypothetical protein